MDLAKIGTFIRRHHVMTLATLGNGTVTATGPGGMTGSGNPVSDCVPGPVASRTTSHPWVAHVFYAWLPADKGGPPGTGCFVFTTDPTTRHGAEMEENGHVAAGIVLETRTVGRLQGLQIEGTVRRPESTVSRPDSAANVITADAGTIIRKPELSESDRVRRAYLKRFPYAVAAGELPLWILEPDTMKLTDNTLGFGKKLIWKR
jgi:uncharacterized protein YhbP (UPF0306 family)